MENKIIVGSEYCQLTGIGTEYIVRDGQVIAKFLNGNLEEKVMGSQETTLSQGEENA
jgi:hypothetical protein